jgi:CysZ protein
MIEDAVLAFTQAFSPPLRRILLKAVALAFLLLLVLGVLLQIALARMVSLPQPFEMALAIATSLGMVAAAIYLMGPITALTAALFLDEIAAEVERTSFPADPAGRPLPIAQSVLLSVKFFGVALAVNFVALLWREYFELAGMRFRPLAEARALRRENALRVFLGGLVIAALLLVPVLNLITPVFATAFMVRMHKRLSPTRELLPPDGRLPAR